MKKRLVSTLIFITPIPLLLYSLSVGPSSSVFTWKMYWEWVCIKVGMIDVSEAGPDLAFTQNILENIRMPRVLLTFIIGSALSVSGSALQSVFRNPLVDPYVLGISSGSAFGAALALVFPVFHINVAAFIFGIVAVLLTYGFSMSGRNSSIVGVILSGMIVSGIFTALLTIVQYISDPYKLQAIVQWTMGNLHHASWDKFTHALIPICIGLAGIYLMRWRLNLLALGDMEAKAVGVNPQKDKFIVIALATLITSGAVAAAGIISLYGLFVPHLVRMLVGPDHLKSVPACMLFGGSFLVIIDNFSRSLLQFEIPIGIFTMLLGAPFFLYLMKKNKINWV